MSKLELGKGKNMIKENEADAIYKKLDGWLENLKREVMSLSTQRYIYREVGEIIKNNKQIQKPSHFYNILNINYFTYVLVTIRRLVDRRGDSVSFLKLLEQMQNNAIVFNRDRFLKHYESNDMLDLGIKDFEQFSDQGMDHISRDMIKRDISKLKSVVQKCNEYVNTRIAHQSAKLISGRADQSEIPTVTDIDECIDYLEELLGKYYLLFHAATFATIVPKFQYDWKAIFRKTWIRE